jgi:hypothetical protein
MARSAEFSPESLGEESSPQTQENVEDYKAEEIDKVLSGEEVSTRLYSMFYLSGDGEST